MSITKAHDKIVDWNADSLSADEYKPIDKEVLKEVFRVIPNDFTQEYHWLHVYLDFCPECGCMDTSSTGEMSTYPESYQKTTCEYCGFLLHMVDNSPLLSWYMFKEDNFKVEV